MVRPAAVAFSVAALLSQASAAPTVLSDADLVAYARSYQPKHWPDAPEDGVVGLHHGAAVVVLRACSDLCPAYLMYVIHYGVDPGPKCDALDGKAVEVMVPVSIAVTNRSFCVPRPLVAEKLYTGHWMQQGR